MAEAKVSTKAPTTTAKKSKGEKERDVIGRIKEFLPQWEIQKVEAFCAEHNHDLDKIHQALDGSYERTGHQPDDWQVMTKKEQKPKRGGGGGSREPRENRPREDRPKGDRGAERSGDRGRGRGGGEPRGRGRGGAERGGRGGGRGGRGKDATTTNAAPTTEPVADAWGTTEAESTSPAGFQASAPAAEPEVVPARAPEPVEKVLTWAEKFGAGARKSKVVSEIASAEAFPQQSQQILGPAIVHTQPPVQQPQAGTSYRAALQGNSRWGKKPEPVVDTSVIEQQTSTLAIDSFQQTNYQAVEVVQQTLPSDVLNAIPVQETSSFPQAEVFQPEPTFQAPTQTDSFIYQTTQTQASAAPVVAAPTVIQSAVFAQPATTEFSAISELRAPHSFAPDNGGKLVIDLLSATNSVILPHSEPLSYGIEFGSFGQSPQPTTFASVQAEPVPQPEQLKVPTQQAIEPAPTEPQVQLSQTAFASDLRDDTLPVKQQSADNTASSQFSQNQYYQPQNQSQAPPQTQAQQPAGFRGPPAAGGFDPHYAAYAFPYENQSPYYNDFAARDSQPQSYHYNDQYPSGGFRGGAAAPSGGNRRPTSNTNQPFFPGRGGLLNTSDGPSGSASPPTSEAELSPNSAKSGSFSNKAGNFAGKQPFNNPATKMPQIPPYNAKPTGVPASTNYNKQPPATTSQPAPKSFKANQPQGSQSQQHHPDPQHYMPYPPGMYGYPYPYPYQPPVMHQMPYGAYDPRYGYPYPGPVQSFEGEFDFPKGPAHYSEGGNTPRSGEWSGNGEGQKPSNNASNASSSAPSTNALPSSMSAAKSAVAPGGANKKPARFEYAEQDPHYNSGYGFSGAPASSPMAMHAAAAPYQPTNYGQPVMHPMGGQAPYGNPQFESHRGYNHGGQNWQ